MVLSRIIELAAGKMIIDGKQSSRVNIKTLRDRITVIPQDPVIFSGTLKFNLDPARKHTDKEIEDLCKKAGLDELLARELEGDQDDKDEKDEDDDLGNGRGIYYKLSDGGAGLSSGEKQLLCIIRAALRRNKVVLLDEATANIDVVTEQKVQGLISEAFKESTVLTIAHRINTIIDSDRILLLEDGKLSEYDSPKTLTSDPNSGLSQLLTEIKKDKEN